MISQTLWMLICAQWAMGAFDVLFHHEFTERLAWRKSQRHELHLHGLRNLAYAILFLVLGFVIPYGLFAYALLVLLLLEILITLKDFVEEDETRKLPHSERITHTLLAINYGAIIALLTPLLLQLGTEQTGLAFTHYGWWSVLVGVSVFGVALFGIRDLFAAKRLSLLAEVLPSELITPKITPRRILITGGTGFIGTRLVQVLVAAGDEVTVVTRNTKAAMHLSTPVRLITSLNQIPDTAQFDAIINLAGASIVGGFWTAKRKRLIYRSRIRLTRQLVMLMQRLVNPPKVFISGSAIGRYGVEAGHPVDEYFYPIDDGSFSLRLCAAWEREALAARKLGIRTILLRIGIVLDRDGGSLSQMLAPFEFGLGGAFGNGQQKMSWISRNDIVRLVDHCLSDTRMRGPINAVSPQPVSNKDFVAAIGEALHRPSLMTMPAWLLKLGLGAMGKEIFLASQNILPTEALRQNFHFHDTELRQYLKTQLQTPKRPAHVTAAIKPLMVQAAE